jgi:hypothetical protein
LLATYSNGPRGRATLVESNALPIDASLLDCQPDPLGLSFLKLYPLDQAR